MPVKRDRFVCTAPYLCHTVPPCTVRYPTLAKLRTGGRGGERFFFIPTPQTLSSRVTTSKREKPRGFLSTLHDAFAVVVIRITMTMITQDGDDHVPGKIALTAAASDENDEHLNSNENDKHFHSDENDETSSTASVG